MLKQHRKTVHEGLNDYDCEYCDRSFSNSWFLKSHIINIHEGQKDNKCEKYSLKTNISSICQDQIHKCDLCLRFFNSISMLKQHTKTVHEGLNDYDCEYCDRSFTNSWSLKNH